jgi:predicted DNA-binding protein
MNETHMSVRSNPRLRKKLKLASEVTGRQASEIIREAVEKACDQILEDQPLSVTLKDYIGALASEEPGNSDRSRELFEEYLDQKFPRNRK